MLEVWLLMLLANVLVILFRMLDHQLCQTCLDSLDYKLGYFCNPMRLTEIVAKLDERL